MNLSFDRCGEVGIVRVESNRIDAGAAIQFKDRFREVIAGAESDVILDLSQVEFLDSSGLGAVVAARKLMPTGKELGLAGLTPAVDKVMRLTRMNTVFEIHPDLPSALAARGTAS
ncbi:Anti-sigma F factor antagonist (spoIIAA-2), Anti-sigma B factor antagonist RsbV [Roseibacterium elongatum DSM 19469]|uniref:Anti-sigma factor antagonist n=1 Tax=Roseicyclus elongatus DSM 19469 TaxID=1294273 RepID=W8RZD6_9RHOB|nr:STAS domain-containing protein [Roseibacterium elongatum]AHM03242.1 Anti-sigma F factor antagonist (spoIIAA-2), Anti-sigma B factor antagonist RsbV [Roseibacterium elongatum DSM 19469]